MSTRHSISLLRERFTITDLNPSSAGAGKPLIALSNRIVVALKTKSEDVEEEFVVRAQNMHSCVRMVARLHRSYSAHGSIMNRASTFDWETAFSEIFSDYEARFNPDLWVAVYYKGRLVFSHGERHPFLDVIEKCDYANPDSYEKTLIAAEAAFKKAGKTVQVECDSNVAMVLDLDRQKGRCSEIVRTADKVTTFSFSVSGEKRNTEINPAQILNVAAAFLEGIQLAFLVAHGEEKLARGLVERHSEEEKKARAGKRRLGRLSGEIEALESIFEVHYRPERPSLSELLNEAHLAAAESLAAHESSADEEDAESEEPES